MDSFYTRLTVWLGASEDDRRKAMFFAVFILATTGFVSWRTTLVIAGLVLMFEGWAMLVAKSTPKR